MVIHSYLLTITPAVKCVLTSSDGSVWSAVVCSSSRNRYIKESKTKLVENSENDRGSVCDCDNEVSIEDCLLSRTLDCLLPLPVLSLYSVFCQQNGNGDPVFRKERTFCLSLLLSAYCGVVVES
jgi:hypothetical protein